jgi:hypothetical protein
MFESDLEATTFLETSFENSRFLENSDGCFCGTKVIPESLFRLV